MKKFYSKIDILLNDDIAYQEDNYISAYSIIETYFKSFKEELKQISNYDITYVLQNALNDNLNGTLTYDQNDRSVTANVLKEDYNLISLKYDCRKPDEAKISYIITNTGNYKEGDIEMFDGILKNEVKEYAKKAQKFNRDFDSSHKGMSSINSFFYLYFVDDEIIIFPSKFNYIDVTLNDNDAINIDYKNMDKTIQSVIDGNEEKLLKNIYFDINDAPDFLKEELKSKRKEELSSFNIIPTNNIKKRQRKKNWFKI